MNKRVGVMLLTALLAICTTGMAHANLIQNGSFEDPTIPNGTWTQFPAIPNWVTYSGETMFEYQNNIWTGTAADGNQFVELAPNQPQSIAQTIVTDPGEIYTLSFAYKPRGDALDTNNWLEVGFSNGDGTGYSALGPDLHNPLGTGWTYYSYNFTATSQSTDIIFINDTTHNYNWSSPSCGPFLDDVSVNSARVPEPSTLLLFGAGLTGIGIIRRRRTKK